MTDADAKSKNVGGEILCEVFLMSRVAKNPINIPDGVNVNFNDGCLDVKGKQRRIEFDLPESVSLRYSR